MNAVVRDLYTRLICWGWFYHMGPPAGGAQREAPRRRAAYGIPVHEEPVRARSLNALHAVRHLLNLSLTAARPLAPAARLLVSLD